MDVQEILFAKKLAGGGGGGGNSIENISATMANPFAGYENELNMFSVHSYHNYTGIIQMDLTPLGGVVISMPFFTDNEGDVRALTADANEGDNPFIVNCRWRKSLEPSEHVELHTLDILNGGQYIDARSYASTISTVTTICYHPMS